jgi:hypothetical protein
MRFLSQERSTETSNSFVTGVPPVSCPKTPMTCQENPQALPRCPVPTRPWALQATYTTFLVSESSLFSAMFLFITQAQSQRRVAHPPANSTFGVGVGTPGTLANSNLGSGWQVSETHRFCACLLTRDKVWGGTTSSPQRNVSASSAPATTDALPGQGEMPFRSNMNEGWRSNSGTWVDDDTGEFALVSHWRHKTCWPHVHVTKYAHAATRAGRGKSASRKGFLSLPDP